MAPKDLILSLVAMVTCVSASTTTLKIGGHVQDTYKTAFTKWVEWANGAKATTHVEVSATNLKTYAAASLAADVKKMTTKGDATYVDALICPYTSGASAKCVDAVNTSYTGPVMVWGGASDSIFDTNCATMQAGPGKPRCFGFFTVASTYTKTGLAALDAKISTKANVAVIVNNNAFSKSVGEGTSTQIGAMAGLVQQTYTEISVAKAAIVDADKKKITDALAQKPDIVVIAGHNKDVESVIIHIGKGEFMPKAILATNGISQLTEYGTDSKYARCVMMPTQYDSASTTADSVVKWTAAGFATLMGGSASYQQAAAGAVGVALSNAMSSGKQDVTKLTAELGKMNVVSFYGQLHWDAKGKIQKPMFTSQLQGTGTVIVAPTGTVTFPLSGAGCWGEATVSAATDTKLMGAVWLVLALALFMQ